jgi:lysophospholipase L1-like esterase
MQTPESPPARWVRRGVAAFGFLLLAVLSMLLALAITPPVPVTVLGQDLQVAAVAPTRAMSLSGPGVAELFGEGPIDTVQQFEGPLRPRIVWQRFDRDAAAGAFIQTTTPDGQAHLRLDTAAIGGPLARAWTTFLVRLVIIAGVLGALAYLVAATAIGMLRGPGWRARRATRPMRPLVASSVLSMAVTLVAAGITVASARDQLATVTTLADLTGTADLVSPPRPQGPLRSDIEVAVIGDSTAAGVGNTPLAQPTDADIACARSRDSYARVLQSATGWTVENLACASATIPQGLLGTQPRRPVSPPPQVGVLKSITSLRAVIVSVGANDIGWSDFLTYCYGLARCDDQATQQLIRSRLDTFRLQYAQLLQQLSALPTGPEVIVVGYYDPFGDRFDCPALRDPDPPAIVPEGYGFAPDPGDPDPDPGALVAAKIEPLRSILAQLNEVLAQGAQAFGFTSVVPSFDGHELCTAQPWVQGMSDPYPFHPRAAGELAIAAALLPHLVSVSPAE